MLDVWCVSIPIIIPSVIAAVMDAAMLCSPVTAFADLFKGLERGDPEMVRRSLRAILDECMPTAIMVKERGLRLTLGGAAMGTLWRHRVYEGQDAVLIMEGLVPGCPSMVVEMKRASSADHRAMKLDADRALLQIESRGVPRWMHGRVIMWSICFRSREFETAFMEVRIRWGPSVGHPG